MISSPCKTCPRKNLPKDNCIKNCRVLKAVQYMEVSAEKLNDRCAINYTQEYRCNIPMLAETISYLN
jgi:hypothetical protein